MKTITLGRTGIEVSELCFGTLPIGPIQKNVPLEESGKIIAYGLESGITFLDTAKMYDTYPQIKLAMEQSGKRPVISSKSAASDYETMEQDVLACIKNLGIDYVDIFFLHAARVDESVFETRKGAFDALIDLRKKGLVKAIGISTHNVNVVKIAAELEEIDIVFPIINLNGKGILSGTREEMVDAIELCFTNNKGVLFMKALAGGTIIKNYKEAMDFVLSISIGRAAIALGMISKSEVDMNLKYFNGEDISQEISLLGNADKRFYIVDNLCKKCGQCKKTCHSEAIDLVNDTMTIDDSKCITCGYCVSVCKEFAIRMI